MYVTPSNPLLLFLCLKECLPNFSLVDRPGKQVEIVGPDRSGDWSNTLVAVDRNLLQTFVDKMQELKYVH